MFNPINFFQLHPIRADGFPFPSPHGPPYPTFQSHLVLPPSYVLLTLLLVGDLSHLCIFYHNWKGSCWISLVAWPWRDISGELNLLWILSWYLIDYVFFLGKKSWKHNFVQIIFFTNCNLIQNCMRVIITKCKVTLNHRNYLQKCVFCIK